MAAGSVVAPLLAAVLLVGCSAGEAPRPTPDASSSPNFETATGSLVVGDPFTAPTAPTETLPPVVPGLSLEGIRQPSGSPVAVTDVVLGAFRRVSTARQRAGVLHSALRRRGRPIRNQ